MVSSESCVVPTCKMHQCESTGAFNRITEQEAQLMLRKLHDAIQGRGKVSATGWPPTAVSYAE